jgi:hypothetical protein
MSNRKAHAFCLARIAVELQTGQRRFRITADGRFGVVVLGVLVLAVLAIWRW